MREPDLNRRPSGYEPDELPDCSIPRLCGGILQANGEVSTDNPVMGQISVQSRQTVAGEALSFGIGTISAWRDWIQKTDAHKKGQSFDWPFLMFGCGSRI
ncbi:hypothetical protein EMIT0P2_30369 [Pseudomonas sp. IT-P2]